MIRDYLYGAALVVLLTGGWYYGHTRYDDGYNAAIATQAKASTKAQTDRQAKQAAGNTDARAITHKGALQIATTQAQTHETVRTIIRYIRDHPADPVCVAADPVMRKLADQVHAANTSGNPLRQ